MSLSHMYLFIYNNVEQACEMTVSRKVSCICFLVSFCSEGGHQRLPFKKLVHLSLLIAYGLRGPTRGVSIHVEGNTLSFIRMCVGVQRRVNPYLEY